MVKDAEENAEEDKKRREEIDLRNEADQLVFTTDKTIKDLEDKVTEEEKTKAEEAKEELKTALEGEDLDEIKAKKEALEEQVQQLSVKLYEQMAADQQAAEGTDGEDEDVGTVNKEQALEAFLLDLKYGEFNDYVRVDENDLREKLGLEIDDDGNYYDPLEKDLDNDGIPDRYDNDFRSSNYFESTYDVDGLKKDDKESTLVKLKKYKAKVREEFSLSQEDIDKEKDKGAR